jgi:hypothetical protein
MLFYHHLSIVASSHILHETSSSTSGQLDFGISYYEFGGFMFVRVNQKPPANHPLEASYYMN